jgi:predicted deacylase
MSSPSAHVDLGSGRRRFHLPVATLASGYDLAIPVLVMEGARPGPRVGVSAMVHGDELDGLLIVP